MSENSVYDKNMKSLEISYRELYDGILSYQNSEHLESNVHVDLSVKNEKIIYIEKDDYRYYLNSRYDNQAMIKEWAKKYDKINYQSVFVVFGLSNFDCVKELLKITQKTNYILFYEPDINVFIECIKNIDISKEIENIHSFICIKGLNDHIAYEFMQEAVEYSKINLFVYCCMFNYEKIYTEDWKSLIEIIKSAFEIIILDRNTQIMFSNEFIVNMLSNFDDMVEQYSINDLIKQFSQRDMSKIPAFIVSAGPSLDKNIDELKQAVGKSVIIAVDTALKTLLQHDILPNYVITVDAHKPPYLFLNSKFTYLPMIVCQHSNKEIWPIHRGQRFYFGDDASFISSLYEKYKNEALLPLETGGSVANNAFSFAQSIGCKILVLVGQDLAYSDSQKHVKSAYDGADFDKVETDKNKDKYIQVEDIYGNKIYTDKSMGLYLKWFEKQIVRYKDLHVIDATEGGAKIHGSKIMALKETIATYCNNYIDIQLINNLVPKMFPDEIGNEVKRELINIPNQVGMLKSKIKKGIRSYDKLYELYKKGKTFTSEYKNVLNDIKEINELIETEPVMELVALYTRKTEYEIQANVYKESKTQDEEVKNIVDSGVKMMKSYCKGIEELNDDIDKKYDVDMYELYSWVREIKIDMVYIVNNYQKQNYYEINMCMITLTKALVKSIDLFNNYNKKHKDKLDENILFQIISDVNSAYENKNYMELSDMFEGYYISEMYQLLMKIADLEEKYWEKLYDTNLEEIKKIDSDIYNIISNVKINDMYNIQICFSGEICILKNSYRYNSLVDPYSSAQKLLESIHVENKKEYLVIGYNAPLLESIYFKYGKVKITVYEHDINIISLMTKYYNLRSLFEVCNMKIIYDPNFEKLSDTLKNNKGTLIINQSTIDSIDNITIKNIFNEALIKVNSTRNQEKMLKNNFIENIVDSPKLVSDIINDLKNKNVLYIAGGPSLDDDIKYLQNIFEQKKEKNAVIISSGTSLKKLIGEKIIPDYVIISDPKDSIVGQLDGVTDMDMSNITMLYLSTVSHDVIEKWIGDKYMILQKDFDVAERYARARNEELFDTGGSVSTIAVDVAIRGKCRKLVCVGLDLAYTNEKLHADNTRDKLAGKTNNVDNLFFVESNIGGNVKTGQVLNIYRKFIEHRLEMPDVIMEVINTSKGAKVKGMKYIPLEETL